MFLSANKLNKIAKLISKRESLFICALLVTILCALFYYNAYLKNENKFPDLDAQLNKDIAKQIKERQTLLDEKLVTQATTSLSGFTYKPITKEVCKTRPGQDGLACNDYLTADEALISKDPKICNKIESDNVQQYCIQRFLMNATSPEICDMIRTEFGREICFKNYARNNNDEMACTKNIHGEYDQKECLGSFKASQASATGEISECEKIDILEYRGLCFERIIGALGNDCRKIKDSKYQLECQDLVLYSSALDLNNQKACDLISEPTRKKVCNNVLTIGRNVDTDNDGINDNKELWFTTQPFVADTDSDGLNDGDEMNKYHTDPTKADTDGDTESDGLEISKGSNPKGLGKYEDSFADYDSDGLNTFEEKKYGSNPLNQDTDSDGYKDGEEVKRGYNPNGLGKLQIK